MSSVLLDTCPSGECDQPDRIHLRDDFEQCQHLADLMNDPGPSNPLAWVSTSALAIAGHFL